MINKLKNKKSLSPACAGRAQAGFTVLEAIVAILVLSISISGVFSAVRQGLAQSTIAKDEVTTFYLAQEAIEIISNKRDNNELAIANGNNAITWLTGITDAANCPVGKVCRADSVSNTLVLCGNSWGTCPVLKQDANSFLYNYAGGNNSPFTREVQTELVPGNPNEIAVTVRITWVVGSIPQVFKIKTFLFNWI